MASSYTGLGTELMTTGENAGTWGTTTNTNLQIIEQIAGGYIEQAVSTTTTLSVSDGSTDAVLAHRIIKFTGTLSANATVTIPLDVQQMYILVNGTSGAYTVQFKYATGSGSSVTFATTDKVVVVVTACSVKPPANCSIICKLVLVVVPHVPAFSPVVISSVPRPV